ncbi:MAG: hypothetical protein WA161_10850 [Pseudomonas sp.]|uniref:hypothetical protein n=1 Tax=Pseudomonas sp. TaxID=306 RepID=UPI003BB5DB04
MADAETKPTCFVIQTFDGSTYDLRYKETIRPALIKADVEPQRADEILGLNPIIDKIEAAIEAASICIAEVSVDNPNVWFELGYALALNRPTVILCEKSIRPKLPFDIQHRPVIFYRTDSKSGYDELEYNIVKWIKNELNTASRVNKIETLKPGIQEILDLEDYEVAALSAAFAFWPTSEGGISHWQLAQKFKDLKFSEMALALAVSGLMERGLLTEKLLIDRDFDNSEYKCYFVTNSGVKWLQSNKRLLMGKEPEKTIPKEFDEEIPF